jgi:hypothetical protein
MKVAKFDVFEAIGILALEYPDCSINVTRSSDGRTVISMETTIEEITFKNTMLLTMGDLGMPPEAINKLFLDCVNGLIFKVYVYKIGLEECI